MKNLRNLFPQLVALGWKFIASGKNLRHTFYHSIFWGWNFLFLVGIYGATLPHIFIPLVKAIFAGEIEAEFLIPFLGLLLTPLICTGVGFFRLRKYPLELMRFFFGVEAPLFILCLLRMFVIRELTGASFLITATLGLAIFTFAIEVFYGYLGQRPGRDQNRSLSVLPWLQTSLHSLLLFVGLYAGILALFYAVPLAGYLIVEIFSLRWLRDFLYGLTHYFWSVLWSIPIFALFFVSMLIFVATPSAFTFLYIHSGQRILKRFAAQYGRKLALGISLGVVTVWAIAFVHLSAQPQSLAFQLLAKPPETSQTRAALLQKSDLIRQGLTNAYLLSYRYLGTKSESNLIASMYRHSFGLPEPLLMGLQEIHNQMLSPFLYQGERSDRQKASKLYAEFFDTSIQKGERQAIVKALKSTAILDDAKAGVLNIDQKKVWLQKQEVNFTQKGDLADVEIHEMYRNQTFDVEEIFYSFSLPESAVLTGVWLGDTANKATRFPFQVSPRGAAQKVYNSQVQRPRPVDPALLEQVGPRQYRLRAFPIPRKVRSNETTPRPTELHLWLTYKVLRQKDGFPLPQLAEKRNIFWTKSTERFRNGQSIKGFDSDWLEATLPATVAQPSLHQVNLNNYQITAQPLTPQNYILAKGKRLAIILDTSYSMGEQRRNLQQMLQELTGKSSKNDPDLYVTSSPGMNPQRLDDLSKFETRKQVFYGTLQLPEMLQQFAKLQGNTNYDAILVITDRGSYELSKDKAPIPTINAPLWLVHLGHLPPAYNDGLFQTIQASQGGVATEITEVLQRLGTTEQERVKVAVNPDVNLPLPQVVSVTDGYVWKMGKTSQTSPLNDDFAPVGARMLVQGLSRELTPNNLEQLDGIHAIAKTYKTVTPYSSMIVLVNDQQRKALQEAEASKDRFDRQVETGTEDLQQPNNPLSTSVPEPGLILGLVGFGLFLITQRRPQRQ